MKLKLNLFNLGLREMTSNYHYPLSSAIYNLLRFGSSLFSAFLHDTGFKQNGKTYKLFTFALRFEQIKFVDAKIFLQSPHVNLYISSPLIDSFIHNFVIGTFEKQTIEIKADGMKSIFKIEQIETMPEPVFKNEMKFILLSPLVLSVKKEFNGKINQYYLRPDDTEEINRTITNNLLNKYTAVYNNEITTDGVTLTWDDSYIQTHPRVTKKVTIKDNGKTPIDVIGIQAPFSLIGDERLIKVGYECGYGEKNALGLGMAEPVYN